MKKAITISVLICIIAFSSALFSQQKINVQNGTTATFYTDLVTAVNEAPDGATIYIPGGVFPITGGNLDINKKLSIYGVGHYPDPILKEKGRTVINGNIRLGGNAQNIHIEGFCINGNIQGYDANNDNIQNLVIKRVRMNDLHLGGDLSPAFWSNILLTECVIQNIYHAYASNVVYERNLVNGQVFEANNSNNYNTVSFNNNIFFLQGASNEYLIRVQYATFNGNIILDKSRWTEYYMFSGNNQYYNNVFQHGSTGYNKDNIIVNDITLYFEKYTSLNSFSYEDDYHIKSSAPDSIKAAGIYGNSSFPYKENAIPITPHIKSSTVSNQTTNGKIQVNIEVEAQTK